MPGTISRRNLERAFENSAKAIEAWNGKAMEAVASGAEYPYQRIHIDQVKGV